MLRYILHKQVNLYSTEASQRMAERRSPSPPPPPVPPRGKKIDPRDPGLGFGRAVDQLRPLGREVGYVVQDGNSFFESVRQQMVGSSQPTVTDLRDAASHEGQMKAEKYLKGYVLDNFNYFTWYTEMEKLKRNGYWNDKLTYVYMNMLSNAIRRKIVVVRNSYPPYTYRFDGNPIDFFTIVLVESEVPNRFFPAELTDYTKREVESRMSNRGVESQRQRQSEQPCAEPEAGTSGEQEQRHRMDPEPTTAQLQEELNWFWNRDGFSEEQQDSHSSFPCDDTPAVLPQSQSAMQDHSQLQQSADTARHRRGLEDFGPAYFQDQRNRPLETQRPYSHPPTHHSQWHQWSLGDSLPGRPGAKNSTDREKIHSPRCDQHRWQKEQERDEQLRENFDSMLLQAGRQTATKTQKVKTLFGFQGGAEEEAAPSYLHNTADDVNYMSSDQFCICHAKNM